jgi:hypothetical protein
METDGWRLMDCGHRGLTALALGRGVVLVSESQRYLKAMLAEPLLAGRGGGCATPLGARRPSYAGHARFCVAAEGRIGR